MITSLGRLEEAFEGQHLAPYLSLLDKAAWLSLLLGVHAVCMPKHIGNQDAVQALCRVLKEDPGPLTRRKAAFTMPQLGYRSGVTALIATMQNDEGAMVRDESAVALSSIGDDRVLPELEKAIEDEDEDVANSALIAFEYLSYPRRRRESSENSSTI